MTEETMEGVKSWLDDFKKLQAGQLDDHESTFKGSANILFNKILEEESDAFPVVLVAREDLIGAGYPKKEVMKMDDDDMRCLASKMTNGLMEDFWEVLELQAEGLFGLRKKK